MCHGQGHDRVGLCAWEGAGGTRTRCSNSVATIQHRRDTEGREASRCFQVQALARPTVCGASPDPSPADTRQQKTLRSREGHASSP